MHVAPRQIIANRIFIKLIKGRVFRRDGARERGEVNQQPLEINTRTLMVRALFFFLMRFLPGLYLFCIVSRRTPALLSLSLSLLVFVSASNLIWPLDSEVDADLLSEERAA